MSIIACKVHKDKIVIGADSAISYGSELLIRDTKAKIEQKDEMVIAHTGYTEEFNLLRIFLKTNRIRSVDEFAVLEFLSEFADWKAKKTKDSAITSSFLILLENKIFGVHGFNVFEIKDYLALGSGYEYAMACFYLGKSVQKAIDVACYFNPHCEPPINLYERKL